jgi:putative transposase
MPGQPFHVIQRGNNRAVCFYTDEDYEFYLYHLQRLSEKHQIKVHAYVLMTNHVHLLMTGKQQDSLSNLMKYQGQRYVQYINKTYKRSGALWEGRFKSCLVDADEYLLECQRYIELNPVRAGMVEHPADYRWSSYRSNGQGEFNPLIKPHDVYEALASNPKVRWNNYRELFCYQLEPGIVDEIRQATNGGYVLGREDFKEQIEKASKHRTTRGKPGRPFKKEVKQDRQHRMEL